MKTDTVASIRNELAQPRNQNPANMTHDEQLAAIYARIPDVKCKGLCRECCGPIGMSRAEMAVLQERVGARITPMDIGAAGVMIISAPPNLTCPLLSANGRCSVYDIRPAICRLWGVVKAMRCPHGCRPQRWLSDAEAQQLLAEAQAIGGASPIWNSLQTHARLHEG